VKWTVYKTSNSKLPDTVVFAIAIDEQEINGSEQSVVSPFSVRAESSSPKKKNQHQSQKNQKKLKKKIQRKPSHP
jgi:hypothetical protein